MLHPLKLVQDLAGVAFCLALLLVLPDPVAAQAPGVPIYTEGRREQQFAAELAAAAEKLRNSRQSLQIGPAREQLRRTTCALSLPATNAKKLAARDVWRRARQSHLRVGWTYLCAKCSEWHLDLAGGYVLTKDGAVATCYHVVRPPRDARDGFLLAADDAGNVFPVTEVLAASRAGDACIVRVQGGDLIPLPLSTNVAPGDTVYCFGDPADRRGYFSQGIVNRFYEWPARGRSNAPGAPAALRINVSTDWAPGSSGSAVLDECANAIGHVSTISAFGDEDLAESPGPHDQAATLIVFHEAVSARDVLALIRKPN